MARRQPITRKDHLKNKGRKTGQGIEKPKELLRDDEEDSVEKTKSTETSMTREDGNEKEDAVAIKDKVMRTPEEMIIDIKKKDGDTDTSSLGTGVQDKPRRVAKDGKLSIIQKSKLMNWAEEHFLRRNKIMMFEEAANDAQLHKAACKAMELEESDWAIVGMEAIKKLRSAMSDRVSIHRKVVKKEYMGKCMDCIVWECPMLTQLFRNLAFNYLFFYYRLFETS
jgi:hypothetical protein